MGREVGGGIGMGKTCEPKAFSFQCMTKFTTKKKYIYIYIVFMEKKRLFNAFKLCSLENFELSMQLFFKRIGRIDAKQEAFRAAIVTCLFTYCCVFLGQD